MLEVHELEQGDEMQYAGVPELILILQIMLVTLGSNKLLCSR